MVLKLIDICMNSIAKNVMEIKYLDISLTAQQKELIIERLANHNLLNCTKNLDYLNYLKRNLFTANLKSLKFYKCEQINEHLLKTLAKNCQFQLKSLSICRCVNVTDEGLKELLVTQVNLEELKLRRLVTCQFTQTSVHLKSTKLEFLDLSYSCLFNDKDLINVCKNNKNLKSLLLTHCSLITNDGMKSVFNILNSLECLDVEGLKGIDESVWMKFKNLKKLNFYGSDQLNSSAMTKLFENCSKLVELNILYSLAPTTTTTTTTTATTNEQQPLDQQRTALLTSISLFSNSLLYLPNCLESLTLVRPNIKDPQVLIDSLKRLKRLKKLSLYCVECISDQALTQILEVIGHNLLSLGLEGYMALPNRLTDTSVKSIAKYCKNLESLCLNLFSSQATLDSLIALFSYSQLAATADNNSECKRVTNFKTIKLSACRSVSYELLFQITSNCVNLVNLDLSGLNDLVDDSLIDQLASNALRLTHLDLKACIKLTDKSICLLATKCPIKCLILSGINNLTDRIVFFIANHLQFHLEEIYLSGCSKISRTALNYLADCCINHVICEHRVPNQDPNVLWAKNLDTGFYERVDQIDFD